MYIKDLIIQLQALMESHDSSDEPTISIDCFKKSEVARDYYLQSSSSDVIIINKSTSGNTLSAGT